MPRLNGLRKRTKIIFITLLILCLTVVGGIFLIQHFGPPYLVSWLEKKVTKETNARYQLQIDHLSFDLWGPSVSLTDLHLNRNPLVAESSGTQVLDAYDVHLKLQEIRLENVDIFQWLKNKEIHLENLQVVRPEIIVRENADFDPVLSTNDTITVDSSDFDDFSSSTAQMAPPLSIASVAIIDGDLDFFDGKHTDPEVRIKGFNTRLLKLHSANDAPFSSEALSVKVDTVSSMAAQDLARIQLMGLEINDTLIRLDSLHFGYLVGRYQLNKIKGFRASWFDIQGNDLVFEGIDYDQMLADSALIIQKVSLDKFYLEYFKDKAEPTISPSYKPLPSEIIRDLNLPAKIDTIALNKGTIAVRMQAAAGKAPGELMITKVNAEVLHFTNLPDELAEDPYLTLRIKALMMDQGPIDLKARFKIDSPIDYYEVDASVGTMPAQRLNHFMGSQFFFEFSSGQLDGVRLTYTGNRKGTKGDMDFEYSDLKIAKLANYKKFRAEQPNNGLLLTMGNWILPRKRSKEQRAYSPGVVFYQKPPNRDVIHCLVESLLSGMISSFGFGPKSIEQAEKNSTKKEERKAKKADRKAKKAAKKANKQGK